MNAQELRDAIRKVVFQKVVSVSLDLEPIYTALDQLEYERDQAVYQAAFYMGQLNTIRQVNRQSSPLPQQSKGNVYYHAE